MSDRIKVRVLKLGFGGKDVSMNPGATVQDCLRIADFLTDVESGAYSVTKNGVGTYLNTTVAENDTITLSGKVVGGR